MSAPIPVAFLGQVSAEATISQLRQTRIQPSVIHLINLLLDEIITNLIVSAQSINPKDLRTDAVPQLFSAGKGGPESTGIKSLARECTGEAELELRSWYELNPGPRKGFPPGNSGRGMTASKEQAGAPFPVGEAVNVMRLRLSELSSYSGNVEHYEYIDDTVLASWRAAGGDACDDTLEPAAAWLHAFVERICEGVLEQLNRVVERDSSIATCGPRDLYTALAENERFWGWFARTNSKIALDETLQASTKYRDSGSRPTTPVSKSRLSGTANDRGVSIDSARKTPSPRDSPKRGSSDAARLSNIVGVTRKGSAISKKLTIGLERKESNLSSSLRHEERPVMEDEDEFDALVRSGDTMKVSLTPSRLKTFESSGGLKGQSGLGRLEARESLPRIPLVGPPTLAKISPIKPTLPPARSGSDQRLVARPATTIEELTEEESKPSPSKGHQAPKEESLKELFASTVDNFASHPPVKRKVPAVILASPPPGHASSGNAESSSNTLDPSATGNLDTHTPSSTEAKTRLTPRQKPRSEARELADFFNSVPPPPSLPSEARTDAPPLSAKTGKGLRGLMSKVTGSSKKKEEEARIARENAAWEIPTAPRHKRSTASASTIRTAPPPSAHRDKDGEPAVPTKSRKRPDPGVMTVDSTAIAEPARASEAEQFSPAPVLEFPEPQTQRSDLPIRSEAVRAKGPPSPLPQNAAQDDVHSVSHPRPSVSSAASLVQASNSVNSLATVGRTGHGNRSASDVTSFVTADEGYDAEERHGNGDVTSSRNYLPAHQTNGASPNEADLLRQRLVYARALLRQATTVEECRLLLDAYLSHIGVPQEADMIFKANGRAEATFAGWLLDGEPEPEVESISRTTKKAVQTELIHAPDSPSLRDGVEDEHVTPKVRLHERLAIEEVAAGEADSR